MQTKESTTYAKDFATHKEHSFIELFINSSCIALSCCGADKHVDPTNYLRVKRVSNDSQKNKEGNKGEITV